VYRVRILVTLYGIELALVIEVSADYRKVSMLPSSLNNGLSMSKRCWSHFQGTELICGQDFCECPGVSSEEYCVTFLLTDDTSLVFQDKTKSCYTFRTGLDMTTGAVAGPFQRLSANNATFIVHL